MNSRKSYQIRWKLAQEKKLQAKNKLGVENTPPPPPPVLIELNVIILHADI